MSGTGNPCSGSSVCIQSPFPKTLLRAQGHASVSLLKSLPVWAGQEGRVSFVLCYTRLLSWNYSSNLQGEGSGFFSSQSSFSSPCLQLENTVTGFIKEFVHTLLMTTIASMEHQIGKSEGARHCVEFSLRKYTALKVLLFHQLNPLIPI